MNCIQNRQIPALLSLGLRLSGTAAVVKKFCKRMFFLIKVVNVLLGNWALQQCMLGMEFSGRDLAGRRVMGLLPAKGLATVVDCEKKFLWEVPENW